MIIQLYLQIGADLTLTTALVAFTRGIESPFISFYLLIIIYCCLALGRNSGMAGAALSTILGSFDLGGDSANLLTPTVGDPNTMIPESKAFMVNVEKL